MTVLKWLLFASAIAFLFYLVIERVLAEAYRKKLKHVVHVNGTRGKSTVARLIGAGLAEANLRVLMKTTGTLPMVIGVSGEETILRRRGAVSIHEQLTMLRYAAAQKADVLVAECMAIDPALQAASQHCILQADVGVITNVRADHADAMGETLREVCEALMHTVPKNGILFTSDTQFFPEMSAHAALQGSKAVLACPDGSEPAFDFPDNVSVALAVCVYLGVPRETALAGMAHFHRDPYAFSEHHIGTNVFMNALSCNDAESTQAVYERARESLPQEMPLVLLLNNRPDRPERSAQMAELAIRLKPAQVLLLGSQKGYLRLRLRRTLPKTTVTCLRNADLLDFSAFDGTCILAAGNIKGNGIRLMTRVWNMEEESHV